MNTKNESPEQQLRAEMKNGVIQTMDSIQQNQILASKKVDYFDNKSTNSSTLIRDIRQALKFAPIVGNGGENG